MNILIGKNINIIIKYKIDKNLPIVKYGSITGIPPIQPSNKQVTKNNQKHIL